MTARRTVDTELDRIAASGFEEMAAAFGGLDNPDLYLDGKMPVDIIQFVEDHDYLGGLVKAEPRVLELLWLIENDRVREAFVEVGKGSGKSFIGAIVPTYGAYLILSMRRPHLYFGLTEDTEIATINVSVGLLQAKNVIFKQMKGLVEKSPWFHRNTKIEALTQQVTFLDRNVTLYCGHSNSTAFLGFATVRAVLDETNFMVNNANRNVAESLFAALRGSCKTRYPNYYKIVAISSAGAPNAWLHNEIESVKRAGKEVPLTPGGIEPTPVHSEAQDATQRAIDQLDIFDDQQ